MEAAKHVEAEFWCLLSGSWHLLHQGAWVFQLQGPLQGRVIPKEKPLYCWTESGWCQWDGSKWLELQDEPPWKKSKMEQSFATELAAWAATCFDGGVFG